MSCRKTGRIFISGALLAAGLHQHAAHERPEPLCPDAEVNSNLEFRKSTICASTEVATFLPKEQNGSCRSTGWRRQAISYRAKPPNLTLYSLPTGVSRHAL